LGAQLFRKKDIDQLITDSQDPEKRLKKSLGWLSLTSLGIGAVIGSGIFTVVGTAIAGQKLQFKSVLNAPLLEYLIYHSASFGRPGAGPAIALSFVLVAVVCGFAALCYAELAAMIPIAGSAYTYTYATMGELVALDHRLGFDSRVRRLEHGRQRRVLRARSRLAGLVWQSRPPIRWIVPAYLPSGLTDLQG
jgi:APA family basic amino acid/polyamine antiporter